MKKVLIVAAAVLAVGACGGDAGEARTDADTLSRAQKDSIIAELPIPGAGAIGDARRAVDKANARVQQHDTIR